MFSHPTFTRRNAIQAGTLGLLGLGLEHLIDLRAAANEHRAARSVIYIFLSGGLAQHDSFDPKPDAPDDIRGEFRPDRHAHARRPHLRAPAAAGRAQPTSGRWSAR